MLIHSIPVAFLVTNSAFDQIKRNLFDDTFAGIHTLAWFDWAILIPYFTVLTILSFYGLHRYEMVRGYYKHRKNRKLQPDSRFTELPPVTIQLPL